ncbi:MAG TPA: AMP-binding protein, partial [Vicinamibacteria bacterium]
MSEVRARTKPVRVESLETAVRRGEGGAWYLSSRQPLGPYPDTLSERLEHWAGRAPERVFLAERTASGAWRTLTYAAALASVRRLGQALVDRRLSQDRPLLILSGNGIDHALLGLAAMYTGVLYAPVAPAYSLRTRDYAALREIVALVEPRLVFAAEGAEYEPALR